MSNKKKKTALITGILGQDGPYLAKFLLDKGYDVYGMIKRKGDLDFSNLEFLGIKDQIEYVCGDMADESSLAKIIKTIRPDELYNLAAQSFVGSSWDKTKEVTQVNSLGAFYLLNALKSFSPTTKYYQASTGEMFGTSHGSHGLQKEETPFHPRSPYAITKLYAYWMTINFRESYNMFCCNGILFNHESPIRGKEFVTRKISDGVARIKLGLTSEIRLGNLDSKRDWGFAGDFVRAMWLTLQQKKPDDYIISTGELYSIRDFLNVAFNHVGIKDWKKYVKIDPKFSRPLELMTLHGTSNKAKRILKWKPSVKFEELVIMMVDADLHRLQKK